ncbi:penicillin-binding transpeptidase domain-containing protein [Corynebacterium sp. sy039]|uniref:penicillin-binding transpeptidase domain-containing protein n=1 Tax=Corynebacterium sp. sy039 TaxID=2599641 RepID=UPI0011B3B07E|nr:penicillin-binding transpeptidase domain-containing protein [Corynebacterium sp. sy039]QDZ41761.1 penicillin-binding protein 2 [Corynebacterium sp. sy039]
MNRAIRFSSIFALLLTLILLINLTVVQVFSEEKYAHNPLNRREFIEQKKSPRGQISAGGHILAESVKDENGFYQRQFPEGSISYGPIQGYISDTYGLSGIEQSYNNILNGKEKPASQWWKQLLNDEKTVGNVELTLMPAVQEVAYSQLANAGYDGAVVAIRPSTGEILAMASTPTFDPAAISNDDTAESAWEQLNNAPGSPLLNHATQETLPPGSTFKVITTAAALTAGTYAPGSTVTGANQITLPNSTATLENYGGQSCAGANSVTVETAFQYSCNTAFVEMAIGTGIKPLQDMAAAFGIHDVYDLGIPMAAGTTGEINYDAELAQSAIGQRDVAMSVLENAVIAATIANGGKRMEPHLVSRILGNDLSTTMQTKPKELNQAIKPEVAATLTQLMQASERHTSGYTGADIASKTGTAEHGEDSRNSNPHAWYIAFGPSKDADVAVAVVVKNGGDRGQAATGGSVAAPIGRAVIEAVQREQG